MPANLVASAREPGRTGFGEFGFMAAEKLSAGDLQSPVSVLAIVQRRDAEAHTRVVVGIGSLVGHAEDVAIGVADFEDFLAVAPAVPSDLLRWFAIAVK